MSTSRILAYALFAGAFVLSACSNGGATNGVVPASNGLSAAQFGFPSIGHSHKSHGPLTGWFKKSAKQADLAYVSDVTGVVDIFDQSGTMVGQLTGFIQPAGIFVDSKHDLWVSDLQASAVYEYGRGTTIPKRTLTDTVGVPYDVTVCPNGTTYVSNYQSDLTGGIVNPNAARGSVEVYARNATTPKRSMQYPNQLVGEFITCDAKNNVFTTLFYGASQSAVVEYTKGQNPGVMLPIALLYVGGVKAEANGNILVGDQAGHNITEYTEAGVATGVTIATAQGEDVQQFAVTKNGKTIGAADAKLKQGETWSFPVGTPGSVLYSDPNFAFPTGFAYDPAAKK